MPELRGTINLDIIFLLMPVALLRTPKQRPIFDYIYREVILTLTSGIIR